MPQATVSALFTGEGWAGIGASAAGGRVHLCPALFAHLRLTGVNQTPTAFDWRDGGFLRAVSCWARLPHEVVASCA